VGEGIGAAALPSPHATTGTPAPPDAPALRRVVVIGCSGSGKSTLARELASTLHTSHVELDALHWGPGWQPRPTEYARFVVAARATA